MAITRSATVQCSEDEGDGKIKRNGKVWTRRGGAIKRRAGKGKTNKWKVSRGDQSDQSDQGRIIFCH